MVKPHEKNAATCLVEIAMSARHTDTTTPVALLILSADHPAQHAAHLLPLSQALAGSSDALLEVSHQLITRTQGSTAATGTVARAIQEKGIGDTGQ